MSRGGTHQTVSVLVYRVVMDSIALVCVTVRRCLAVTLLMVIVFVFLDGLVTSVNLVSIILSSWMGYFCDTKYHLVFLDGLLLSVLLSVY